MSSKKKSRAARRNEAGMAGFCLLACFINLLAWPVMVLRELYQWRAYHLAGPEWDDVRRYTLAIIAGSIINGLIIFILTN